MELDHHEMCPPFLRKASWRFLPSGPQLAVWDLRLAQPNVTSLPGPVLHSLEHMLSVYLRERTDAVVNVAPMGCRTGLYIITRGPMDFAQLAHLLADSLGAIQDAADVPLANTTQCGAADYHSLAGAQAVAGWLLSRSGEWSNESPAPH